MTYIVWHDNHLEGWARSDDLDTLADCFEHIRTETYGHPYVITKPIQHELIEVADNS